MISPAKTDKKVVIEVENVSKTFKVGDNEVKAVQEVDLKIYQGDFVVIFGPSGCGKTTLLNMMTGLDEPTSGRVEVNGQNIFNLDEDERGLFRSRHIGFVQQMSYWVKSLNVLENVALPLMIEGRKASNAMRTARLMLNEIKIKKLGTQLPTQLSGGEQQKAGVARALVSNPNILFADEPTGNLDSKSAGEIIKLFYYLNKELNRTIVMVTHNQNYWESGNRRVEMKDGEIVGDHNHHDGYIKENGYVKLKAEK
ncbi:MAG: ABC transporter ATP-binding protein [Patescibacteria group bacterium]|nr:ABC transporter ATP-binding protein [Patescibacteria group bacterium]